MKYIGIFTLIFLGVSIRLYSQENPGLRISCDTFVREVWVVFCAKPDTSNRKVAISYGYIDVSGRTTAKGLKTMLLQYAKRSAPKIQTIGKLVNISEADLEAIQKAIEGALAPEITVSQDDVALYGCTAIRRNVVRALSSDNSNVRLVPNILAYCKEPGSGVNLARPMISVRKMTLRFVRIDYVDWATFYKIRFKIFREPPLGLCGDPGRELDLTFVEKSVNGDGSYRILFPFRRLK